jgi:hypothetical protein
LAAVPSKLQQFAAEAQSLDAARMQELEPQKRFATIEAVVASRHVEALAQCEAHAAHAGRNYSPPLALLRALPPTLFPI